ncbi:MAG: sialidase family protein [Candidatus Methylacidiphilales bacterium]
MLSTEDRDILQLADLALIPPILNTDPLPRYDYDRLDYGMTIGLERTRGGRLWACWVGGGDNHKAFFVLATSDDDGTSWSKPRLVIDPHDDALPLARRTIVGTLWLDPRGRLWLFFDQSMAYFDGRGGNWYTRCEEPDADNPQWTTPVRIWHGCTLNKPTVRSTGEWLLPVSLWNRGKIPPKYHVSNLPEGDEERIRPNPFSGAFKELDHLRMANVLVSHDEGVTWQLWGGVAYPSPDFDEHHLVERRDGSIWMTARTGWDHGMYHSVSLDGGVTWSKPGKYLEQVSSRHFIRRLASGRLLMVKHGMPVQTRPPVRSHLTAYLSDDDGKTWRGGLLLDERAAVSYPDGTQAPDGRIFISYDWNRDEEGNVLLARFTEEDVLTGRCVSPGSALQVLISRPNPAAVAARHVREKAEGFSSWPL